MDGLKDVNADLWRDVIDLQANWIGSCDGVRFEFQLVVCQLIAGLHYLPLMHRINFLKNFVYSFLL